MSDHHANIVKIKLNCDKIKYINELEGNKSLTELSRTVLQEKLDALIINKPKTDPNANNMFMEMDKMVYQRYWHKLKPFHQKVKLREYIEQLNIKNKSRKEKLIKKLCKAIDDKILTKKETVKYDPFLYTIKNVTGFEYNDKKQKYSFNL